MSETVQILQTPDGQDLAVLPRAEYEALLEALEEAQDAALIRARRNEPALPLDVALQVRQGATHPLTAWRKRAGLTQAQLADQAGLRIATVSDIERGASPSAAAITLKKLADVLEVGIDDLMTDEAADGGSF